MFKYLALVSPPVALALDVFAPSLAEIGRADDEDLEALRPGLVASPRSRAGRAPRPTPLSSTISSSSFIRPLPRTTSFTSSCFVCVWP